jgi:hypothetical protein
MLCIHISHGYLYGHSAARGPCPAPRPPRVRAGARRLDRPALQPPAAAAPR